MNTVNSRVLKIGRKWLVFSGLAAGVLAVVGSAEAVTSRQQTYAAGKPFFNALTIDDLNCNGQPIWTETAGGIANSDCGSGTRGWLVSPSIDATNVNFTCFAVISGAPSGASCGTCWAITVSGAASTSRSSCQSGFIGTPFFNQLGTSALPVPTIGSMLFALDIRAGTKVPAIRWDR